tara:strand:+ start:369 stop:482 length:114 start_codon:yes stop_codon:yes gene_type:complete
MTNLMLDWDRIQGLENKTKKLKSAAGGKKVMTFFILS